VPAAVVLGSDGATTTSGGGIVVGVVGVGVDIGDGEAGTLEPHPIVAVKIRSDRTKVRDTTDARRGTQLSSPAPH
jgi:hypothetical protein